MVELDSAAHGSAVLNPSFGASLATKAFSSPQDIGVDGATGDVYISENPNNPISGMSRCSTQAAPSSSPSSTGRTARWARSAATP